MAKLRKFGQRWMVDYYISGQRSRPIFETRREAELFRRDLELKKKGELLSSPLHRISLKESIANYFENFSSGKAHNTQVNESNYFEIFYKFMLEEGIEFPHEIDLIHLQRLQKNLRKRVAGSTVNRQFNTYKHYLKQCELWKHMTHDPCRGLKALSEEPKQKEVWSEEQIEKFIMGLSLQWYRDVAFLVIRTGIRPSEVCRLVWDDVDFRRRIIKVTTYKGGEPSTRELAISDEILKYLTRLKAKKKSSQYVITNEAGRPMQAKACSTAMHRAIKRLGLKGLVFYGVKHTLASRLHAQGEDTETIRKVLGHKNLNTTQRYLLRFGDDDLVRDALKSVYSEKMDLGKVGH